MGYITKFDGNTDSTITLGKEGDPKSVEGYFLGSKDTPDQGFGPGKLHIFQTSKGNIGVWGKTRLNSLLTTDLIGQMVLATFTGMIAPSKKGRRPSYGFKVQHDAGNTIDTSGIDLTASAPADEVDEETNDEVENTSYASRPATPVHAVAPDPARRDRVAALLNNRK